MKLLILGPPGSGKGTMAKLLAEHFNIVHISTGDLFRDNIKKNTELGKKVKEFLSSGGLVPDQVTMDMLKLRLNQEDAKKGFILDGFPRTIKQAELLDQHYQMQKAILLSVTHQTLMQRITLRRVCQNCGMVFHLKNIPPKKEGVCDVCNNELIQRDDEKEDVVQNRLKVYNKQTVPVIDHYKELGVLLDIDANGTPDEVFMAITSQISPE